MPDSDPLHLAEIARQLRDLFEPVEKESNPARRNRSRTATKVAAAGLIQAVIDAGAFSDARFIQMRAKIDAAKKLPDPVRAARTVVGVAVEELARIGFGEEPDLNNYKGEYELIVKAVDAEAAGVDDWITQALAAEFLNCSERLILRRINDGQLSSSGPKYARKVRRSEILAKKDTLIKRKSSKG